MSKRQSATGFGFFDLQRLFTRYFIVQNLKQCFIQNRLHSNFLLSRKLCALLSALILLCTLSAAAQETEEAGDTDNAISRSLLSEEVEAVKKSAVELNRDLLILEEELLFPANTQLTIFVSMDVGYFFALDAVKIKVDGKLVASHLYTERENNALVRGGVQKLWIGNVKRGDHDITAIATGMGPDNREYKRGATIKIEKDDDPKMLELKIRDFEAKMQPTFTFEEWEL